MAVRMEKAINAMRNVLNQHNVHYSYDGERHLLSLTITLSHTKLTKAEVLIGFTSSSEDADLCVRITSYGLVSLKADEDCMFSVAEYLHRANYGMPFGHFELDFNDGEIRYQMAVNTVDALPGFDALDDLVVVPVLVIDRYGDGLLSVIMGLATPKDAIDKTEGS